MICIIYEHSHDAGNSTSEYGYHWEQNKKLCICILIYSLLSLSYNVYVVVSPLYILSQLTYFHETFFKGT